MKTRSKTKQNCDDEKECINQKRDDPANHYDNIIMHNPKLGPPSQLVVPWFVRDATTPTLNFVLTDEQTSVIAMNNGKRKKAGDFKRIYKTFSSPPPAQKPKKFKNTIKELIDEGEQKNPITQVTNKQTEPKWVYHVDD